MTRLLVSMLIALVAAAMAGTASAEHGPIDPFVPKAIRALEHGTLDPFRPGGK